MSQSYPGIPEVLCPRNTPGAVIWTLLAHVPLYTAICLATWAPVTAWAVGAVASAIAEGLLLSVIFGYRFRAFGLFAACSFVAGLSIIYYMMRGWPLGPELVTAFVLNEIIILGSTCMRVLAREGRTSQFDKLLIAAAAMTAMAPPILLIPNCLFAIGSTVWRGMVCGLTLLYLSWQVIEVRGRHHDRPQP